MSTESYEQNKLSQSIMFERLNFLNWNFTIDQTMVERFKCVPNNNLQIHQNGLIVWFIIIDFNCNFIKAYFY